MSDVKVADEEVFEVFPENMEAVDIFLRLITQWRYSQGVVLGLDYKAIDSIFRFLKVKDKRQIFDDIQVMEFAALRAFEERKK